MSENKENNKNQKAYANNVKAIDGPKNNIFIQIEEEILELWKTNDTHAKIKKKNGLGKRFYFLDGPPYTSGRVHLGTAWNKSLKDCVLRYKRMKGFNVWDRAGYDMHGMPTAQAVQKELKLANKDKILEYGMDKFVRKCEEFSLKNMKIMNEDFKRLGVWMDFENAYYTIDPKYMESCWWLIKKADENKRLYLGEKTMHWCASCGTALAKHELEYKNITDKSIFLKFKILGSENEYLIIWTTTPWTIPFNLGVMVNPELEYVKIRLNINEEKIEQWIIAKGLVGVFMGSVVGKKYDIVEEFKGDKLEGIKYRHPLHDMVPEVYDELDKNHDKTFSVVLSEEYVDLSAGTGLVHMAPGCGPEDYEVGHKNGIPPFNNLNEEGIFPDNMGVFARWTAKKDDKKFIEEFNKIGALIETTDVEHDYAHCWRCKEPVIFRTTKQWFFRIEDLKENMRELNKDIYWNPEFAGSKSFDSWLNNLRDNGITRQRYWGTPLPIWKCENEECN
ncbi:MAG: class I tRNA ligase family protein, partial [Candidatus Woesearchaeota archaeon]